MKILIAIPCLLTGGTEIQTLNLVRALVLGGHDVTTACYFEHSDYMVGMYEQAGSKVVMFSKDGQRMGGMKEIRFLAQHLWSLKRIMKPDVVHVQYMTPGALPIILLKAMGQKNILATAHTNADIYGAKTLSLLKWLQRHVLRAFTCITLRAENNFFGESSLYILGSKAVATHAHFTIYNALPGYISIADKKKVAKDIVMIGVVSRLVSIKGMDLVVPAFAKVYAKYKNVRLLVVGDGTLKSEMEYEAEKLHLTEVASFVGRQEQSTLQDFYDKMDILLMPSRSEGFGLTAIEGMARGCVIVASNTGGLPEVVKDGEVGLLHQSESIDDLAEKIGMLVGDADLLERMRSCALKYVEKFSFERYSELFNDLYRKL